MAQSQVIPPMGQYTTLIAREGAQTVARNNKGKKVASTPGQTVTQVMDAAHARGGLCVYMPGKYYPIADPADLTVPITLLGYGATIYKGEVAGEGILGHYCFDIRIGASGSKIKGFTIDTTYDASTPGAAVGGHCIFCGGGETLASDVEIEDCVLKASSGPSGARDSYCIGWDGPRLRVKNCILYGYDGSNTNRCKMINCGGPDVAGGIIEGITCYALVAGYGGHIEFDDGTKDFIFRDAELIGIKSIQAYVHTGEGRPGAKNLTLENIRLSGMTATGGAITLAGGAAGGAERLQNMILKNITLENCLGKGIAVTGTDGVIVDGLKAEGNTVDYTVYTNDCTGVKLYNPMFIDGSRGMYLMGNFEVINPQISLCPAAGIWGTGAGKIIGGSITSCIGSGISMTSGGNSLKLFGTTLTSNGASGLALASTSYALIAGCDIQSNTTFGITTNSACDNITVIGCNVALNGTNIVDNGADVHYIDNHGYYNKRTGRTLVANILGMMTVPKLLAPLTYITQGEILYTGSTVYDHGSSLANNLTTSPAIASWATKIRDKGDFPYSTFNGTSEYMYRADDEDFCFGNGDTDSAFSVLGVFYLTANASKTLIGKWDETTASPQREWRLFTDADGKLNFALYDESADAYVGRLYNTAITINAWHFVLVTYSGAGTCASVKIYLDGIQVDDTDYTSGSYTAMENTTSQLYIGAHKGASAIGNYLAGCGGMFGIDASEMTARVVWNMYQLIRGALSS